MGHRRGAARLVETLELILDCALGPLDLAFEAVFLVPLLGSVLFYALSLSAAVVWRALALPLLVLTRAGLRVDRRLAVRALVLTKEGDPVADIEGVGERLGEASAILQKQAGVRLAPIRFARDVRPALPLVEAARSAASKPALIASCDLTALRDDLLRRGGAGWCRRLIFADVWRCYFGGARRLLFFGRPLYVFVVQQVKGMSGCSLGPLADYVVVGADCGGMTMAHEIAHACGLWHVRDEANLMKHIHSKDRMTPLQAAVLSTSEHVTPF